MLVCISSCLTIDFDVSGVYQNENTLMEGYGETAFSTLISQLFWISFWNTKQTNWLIDWLIVGSNNVQHMTPIEILKNYFPTSFQDKQNQRKGKWGW